MATVTTNEIPDYSKSFRNTAAGIMKFLHVSHKEYLNNAPYYSIYFYPVTTDKIPYNSKSFKNTAAGMMKFSPKFSYLQHSTSVVLLFTS